jgi:glycosyltransferase involved in cell wall biosynthesis
MKKILYITNQLSFNLYGGAETQLLKTMEYVNKKNLNYQIKLYDMWNDKIKDYDAIHIFGAMGFPYENYILTKYAKDNHLKIILSPIFYYRGEISQEQDIIHNIVESTYMKLRKSLFKTRYLQYFDIFRNTEKMLNTCDIILPNTEEERSQINTLFDIQKEKCIIIPNGVDMDFKYGYDTEFKQKYGLENFILFIGRIEPRKNVLRLIRAFVKSNIDSTLVIIGKIVDENYYRLCIKESNNRVLFLPSMLHDSELLKSAYKSAKVFVLPSYFETPGIAALEGGIAGANIVITKVGGTREYFNDYAWYVDPMDEGNIRQELINAYNAPKRYGLMNYIENNFTWDIVAEKTIDAYDKLLN